MHLLILFSKICQAQYEFQTWVNIEVVSGNVFKMEASGLHP